MKRLIFSFLLLLIFSFQNVYSQSGWVIQPTSVTDDLFAVHFVNPFTGYVVGQNGRMLKTTNGGLNWIIIGSGVTNQFLHTVQFLDANTGFVSGGWTNVFNNFWKTTNGGNNWTLIGTLSASQIQFFNINLGFAIISQGLAKSTSGGNSWSFYSFDPVCPACSMRGLFFHNQNTGYTGGDYWNSFQGMGYAHIFKTTNGGANWNLKIVYQSNANPYPPQLGNFSFPNEQVGYSLGSYEIHAGLWKSTNSGENWEIKKVISGSLYPSPMYIWFNRSDTGWITCTQGKLMYTSDGGNNLIVYTTGANAELNRIFFINDSTGWIAGNDGIVLARNAGLIGVPQKHNLPISFRLYDNYPNPFNPVTRIKFEVPLNKGGERGLSVRLIIYDILGSEIETLVNENKKPGTYEVDWDGSRFSSGVYFYRLVTDDASTPLSITKKMVLIK